MKYFKDGIEFNPNDLSIIVIYDGKFGWGYGDNSIYDDNSGANFTDEYGNYAAEQAEKIVQEYRDYVFTEYIDEDEFCKQHGLNKFTDDDKEDAIDEFIEDNPMADNPKFVERWNKMEDSIAEDIKKNKSDYTEE